MKKLLLLFIAFSFAACGVPQAEYDKQVLKNDSLVRAVSRLKIEIDELKNGEERTVGLIKNSLDKKEFIDAKKFINQLIKKHPESKHIATYNKMMPKIDGEIKKRLQIIEKQKQDSIKLANINNLGIWEIQFYVDEFGEPTTQGHITTELAGTFSNTATQDSELTVCFLISKENDIAIQLFEYANNNPVKCYGDGDYYKVRIRDSKGKNHDFTAINYSERLYVQSSLKLSRILKGGGNIRFLIVETDTPSTKYRFEFRNADWYENALEKLVLTNKK